MPPFDKLWMCLYARLGEYSFPLMGSNHNVVCVVLKVSLIFVLLAGNYLDENINAVEQRLSNFFQVGTTFISQNVVRTTLLLGLSNSLGLP